MLDIMTQSKNAIEAYEQALKISNTNITNMTTPGYKKMDVSFQSIFEKVLSQGTAADGNSGGTNPRQLGQGMAVSSFGIDFSNGDTTTSQKLDMAILGAGLFVVSANGGNSYLYTRAGNFSIVNGSLVTSSGMQVYGLDGSNALVPITGLDPSKTASDYQWSGGGELQYTDGTPVGFTIALTTFSNPNGLAQAQGTTFAETLASGSPATPSAPNASTVGKVQGAAYEKSNVNYYEETIKVAELQRSISANLSMVKLASDLISSFISKLG